MSLNSLDATITPAKTGYVVMRWLDPTSTWFVSLYQGSTWNMFQWYQSSGYQKQIRCDVPTNKKVRFTKPGGIKHFIDTIKSAGPGIFSVNLDTKTITLSDSYIAGFHVFNRRSDAIQHLHTQYNFSLDFHLQFINGKYTAPHNTLRPGGVCVLEAHVMNPLTTGRQYQKSPITVAEYRRLTAVVYPEMEAKHWRETHLDQPENEREKMSHLSMSHSPKEKKTTISTAPVPSSPSPTTA